MREMKAEWNSGHPTPETVLLALEGELPASETQPVTVHCTQCWECRTLRDHLEAGIRTFVDYRQRQYVERLGPPPGGWENFLILLQREDSKSAPRSLRYSLHRTLETLWRIPRLHSGLAAVTAVALIVALVYNLVAPRPVDAAAFLSRAVAAQSARENAGGLRAGKAIRQRIEVRFGTSSSVYQVVRADQLSAVSDDVPTALKTEFEAAHLDWTNPIDPAHFSAWRDSLARRRDHVETAASTVTLVTMNLGAFATIQRASLTVRRDDWHAIAENLAFATGETLSLRELSYEVVSAPVPLSSSLVGMPDLVAAPVVQPATPAKHALPSAEELAQAELSARLALHGIKADLGEEILFTRERKDVTVVGRVDSEARKEEITSALEGIALVSVDVHTYDEAVPRTTDMPRNKNSRQTERVTLETAASAPQLSELLTRFFPDEKIRIAFVNETLAQSQVALDHAFAVERLASRYSPQETALLDARGRQALGMLLTGHYDSMVEALFALDRVTGQLEKANAVAQLQKDRAASTIPNGTPANWREAAGALRASVVEMHQVTRAALAGSERDAALSAAQVIEGLHGKLATSRARLDVLRDALLQEFTH